MLSAKMVAILSRGKWHPDERSHGGETVALAYVAPGTFLDRKIISMALCVTVVTPMS